MHSVLCFVLCYGTRCHHYCALVLYLMKSSTKSHVHRYFFCYSSYCYCSSMFVLLLCLFRLWLLVFMLFIWLRFHLYIVWHSSFVSYQVHFTLCMSAHVVFYAATIVQVLTFYYQRFTIDYHIFIHVLRSVHQQYMSIRQLVHVSNLPVHVVAPLIACVVINVVCPPLVSILYVYHLNFHSGCIFVLRWFLPPYTRNALTTFWVILPSKLVPVIVLSKTSQPWCFLRIPNNPTADNQITNTDRKTKWTKPPRQKKKQTKPPRTNQTTQTTK